MALEHGKKAFLLRSLVDEHEWARGYADSRDAIVVDDVLQHLVPSDRVHVADHRRAQLALEFS